MSSSPSSAPLESKEDPESVDAIQEGIKESLQNMSTEVFAGLVDGLFLHQSQPGRVGISGYTHLPEAVSFGEKFKEINEEAFGSDVVAAVAGGVDLGTKYANKPLQSLTSEDWRGMDPPVRKKIDMGQDLLLSYSRAQKAIAKQKLIDEKDRKAKLAEEKSYLEQCLAKAESLLSSIGDAIDDTVDAVLSWFSDDDEAQKKADLEKQQENIAKLKAQIGAINAKINDNSSTLPEVQTTQNTNEVTQEVEGSKDSVDSTSANTSDKLLQLNKLSELGINLDLKSHEYALASPIIQQALDKKEDIGSPHVLRNIVSKIKIATTDKINQDTNKIANQTAELAEDNNTQKNNNDDLTDKEKETKDRLAEAADKMADLNKILTRIMTPGNRATAEDIDRIMDIYTKYGNEAKKPESEVFMMNIQKLEGIKSKLDAVVSLGTEGEKSALQRYIQESSFNVHATRPDEIYGDFIYRIDEATDLSTDTKSKISNHFGRSVTKQLNHNTGGDVVEALRGEGASSSDSAENTDRQAYTRDHMLQIRSHQFVYEDGDKYVARVEMPGGRYFETEMPQNATDVSIGETIFTLQMMHAAEKLNLAQAIFQRGTNISMGGRMNLLSNDIQSAKKLGGAFLGGFSGQNGELVKQEEIDEAVSLFQTLTTKGDHAAGDNNQNNALESFTELGLLTNDGAVDWSVMERIGLYLQKNDGIGTKNFINLVSHLDKEKKARKAI